MRLQVKGRNLDVTDSIRSYAEQKLKKLDKQLNDATEIELELAVEKNPSIAANQIAEATVWTKGPTLRAREASEDMRASIDQLTEKLVRQVRHYRDKRSYRGARNNVPVDEGVPALENDQLEQQIVKTKQFPDKPMNAEEAVLQLAAYGMCSIVQPTLDTPMVTAATYPMPLPDRYVILHVTADGVREVEVAVGMAERMAFLSCLDLYHWNESMKGKRL